MTTSTQTSVPMYDERFVKIRKKQSELYLSKILHCFLERYGSYSSEFVTFEMKLL